MENLKLIKKDNYVVLQLHRGKVNAINHQMVNELKDSFRTLRADDSVKGVILTGQPGIFSAGLDVIELYGYDGEEIRDFMEAFGAIHVEMTHFPKPLICAINGHSPAGGTVFAITADYRIMAEGEQYTLGLNEVAVNIQISQNLVEGYAFWIGRGLAHRYIMEGKLLNGQEALACGLVDELAPAEELLLRAEQKMKHYLRAHPEILRNTKHKLRKSWLEVLEKNAAAELEQSLSMWWNPEIRARMKAFVDRLTKR